MISLRPRTIVVSREFRVAALLAILVGTSALVTGAELTTVRLKSGFDPVFEQSGGTVRFIEPAPGGKFYIAGEFTTFDDVVRAPLARLNADGTRDPSFAPPTYRSGTISSLAVLPDGRLLVSGVLTQAIDYAIARLHRVEANGAIDPNFAPEINSAPSVIAVQADGKILIAGNFTLVNGIMRMRIARLNADGSLDASFDPGAGPENAPTSIAVQADGKILVGGGFRNINNTLRAYVARLTSTGAVDETFNAGTGIGPSGFNSGTNINSIALQSDQQILVGGAFTSFNGETRRGLIRLNPDGTRDASFALPAEALKGGPVWHIRVQAGAGTLVTGRVNTAEGGVADGIVRLQADGAIDSTFVAPPTTLGAMRIGDPAAAVTLSDGRVLVGGAFSEAGVRHDIGVGTTHLGLMRLSSAGVLDETYAPDLRKATFVRNVWAIPGGDWLVTGDFRFVDGTARPGLARLKADGELDATFNPGPLFDVPPTQFAIQTDGAIVAAGAFTTFDSTPAGRIVRLNANGTRDTSFATGTGFDATVTALAQRVDGKLMAAGGFSSYDGTARNNVALLETTGAIDLSFDPGTGLTLNGARTTNVTIVVASDHAVIASGSFDTYNGTPRLRLARVLASGAVDPIFNTGSSFQFISPEYLLPLPDGKVLGGARTFMMSPISAYIFRLNADGSKDTTFSVSSTIAANGPLGPQQADGKLFLCTSSGLLRVTDTGASDPTFAIPAVPAPIFALASASTADDHLAVASTTLSILENAAVPRITSSLNLITTVGQATSFTITATNSPTTYQAEFLPAGLSLDPASGVISGMPDFAGQFSVSLAATNADGVGRARLTLRVNKAVANVAIGNVTRTYNGQPQPVTVTTDPAGLNVVVSYNGSPLAPTNAGSYNVSATVNDLNFSGSANDTLTIEKATAIVNLTETAYPYAAEPRPALITTTPSGLATTITYDGSTTQPTAQGTYAVVATVDDPNYTGTFTGTMRIGPAITRNYANPIEVTAGTSTTLSVTYGGGSNATYQWQALRVTNGPLSGSQPLAAAWVDLPGETSAAYTILSLQRFSDGMIRVVVTENGLSVPSDPFVVLLTAPPPNTARLLNLSTRAQALTGSDILIPGFVVSGSANKRLLIRAVGPTLGGAPYNVPGTLANPRLALKRLDFSTPQPTYVDIANNDDWGTNANAAAITQTAADLFAFPFADDREAALLVDLAPGQYTVFADGVADATGIAIVELYDADAANVDARLINISNRGFVGTGAQVMIPGFVVSSEGPRTLLIRVVGPTLAPPPYNVPGTMADPRLQLFRKESNGTDTLLLEQDNWGDNPDAAFTASTALAVSAFALANGSADAAFVVTLPPGVYTVVGSAADGISTGVVLVEVYVVP